MLTGSVYLVGKWVVGGGCCVGGVRVSGGREARDLELGGGLGAAWESLRELSEGRVAAAVEACFTKVGIAGHPNRTSRLLWPSRS